MIKPHKGTQAEAKKSVKAVKEAKTAAKKSKAIKPKCK